MKFIIGQYVIFTYENISATAIVAGIDKDPNAGIPYIVELLENAVEMEARSRDREVPEGYISCGTDRYRWARESALEPSNYNSPNYLFPPISTLK